MKVKKIITLLIIAFLLLSACSNNKPLTAQSTDTKTISSNALPGLVETEWLVKNLENNKIIIIDIRSQPEYNTSHIPESLCLNVNNLRGNIGGVGSMLLPADLLAGHFSLMGIEPDNIVILVYGEKVRDASLASMAFERLGHKKYAILNGGFNKWISEGRVVNTDLPSVSKSSYPVRNKDNFTVDYKTVLEHLKSKDAVIIDTRPSQYFSGQKSDEARGGHIPSAVNRTYADDLRKTDDYTSLKPIDDLKKAYNLIIPSKQSTVIVHCRTGHQASQTFFVLKSLLGYDNVYWYDASWSEWAARSELPVVISR